MGSFFSSSSAPSGVRCAQFTVLTLNEKKVAEKVRVVQRVDQEPNRELYFVNASSSSSSNSLVTLVDDHYVSVAKILANPDQILNLILNNSVADVVGFQLIRLIVVPLKDTPCLVGLFSKFGANHLGLAIGTNMIDWNNSSLCHPRVLSGTEVVAVIKIGELPNGEETTAKLKALAQRIAQWNHSAEYNAYSCNCQAFVVEMLGILGISLDSLEGQIASYLDSTRFSRVSREFKDPLTGDTHTFETHRKLDEYIQDLLKRADPGTESWANFERTNPNDAILLKALDRAFWTAHTTIPNAENSPLKSDGPCPMNLCPLQFALASLPPGL